jgi:hypothetical protein
MNQAHAEALQGLIDDNRRIAVHAVLPIVYEYGMLAMPRNIVELGVSKEALMNKVLAMVAREYLSSFCSVDLNDCQGSVEKECLFIQDDARRLRFNLTLGRIDLLTIDLDEKYETTKEVWDSWRPLLSEQATVMFRCTNLKKELIYLEGYSTRLGWDNERGVIRVLEDFFREKFDETKEFEMNGVLSDDGDVWDIHHWPWGAGLTIIKRKGCAL